jgi:hypothetical protein
LGGIGFAPGTGLGRDANAFLRFVAKYLLSPLALHIQYWSTPELTAPVITNVLLNKEGKTGWTIAMRRPGDLEWLRP